MIKQHLTLVFALLALTLSAQRVTLIPAKPAPGETVQVIYKPAGGPLADVADIEPIAAFLNQDKIDVREITWSKDGDQYSGSISTQPGDKAFFVVLRVKGSDAKDDNDGMGYPFPLYTANKSAVVEGANAAIAA